MRFIPFGFYSKVVALPITPAPADTSLAIWLDATATNIFNPSTANGTNITQWSDKAGISHNAAPLNNTARPTVTSSFQNGKTVLYFDGGDGLASNMSTILQSLAGSTVFIVSKATTTGSLGQEQHFIEGAQIQGSNYTPLNAYSLILSGSYGYNLFFAGGQAKTAASTPNTAFHYHTIIFNGSGTANSDRLKYRIDGVEQSLTFGTNIGTTTSATVNALVIGAQGDNTGNLTGYIGEIIVYTRTLTNLEMLGTEAYLKNKWNL